MIGNGQTASVRRSAWFYLKEMMQVRDTYCLGSFCLVVLRAALTTTITS